MTGNSIQASYPLTLGEFKAPLVVGVAAALVAASFVIFHWTAALAVALVVLALAVSAKEWFVIAIFFLAPLSWPLGAASSIMAGLPSYSTIDAMQAVRWLAIGGFFLGLFWRGELQLARLVRHPFALPSLAFAGVVFLSSFLGTPGMRMTSAVRAGTHMFVFLGLFFLILAWADSRQRVERIVRVLLLSVIVASCLGIVQMLIGGYTPLRHVLFGNSPGAPPWSGRASSFFATVDELAVFNCLLLPLALGCYALAGGRWKRIGGWTFLLGTIALICTQSKGGLLALAVVLGLGVLYLERTWKARAFAFTIASFFAGGVFAIVHLASLTHAAELQETSLVGRLLLWSAGWKYFLSSPIHGIGWENFQILHTYEFDAQTVAGLQSGVESLYFQLLSETGLLGFVAFFLLLYLAYRAARKGFYSFDDSLGRAISFGLLGAVAVILVQGITEAQLEVPQLGAVLWMLLALFAVIQNLGGASAHRAGKCGKRTASDKSPEPPQSGGVPGS